MDTNYGFNSKVDKIIIQLDKDYEEAKAALHKFQSKDSNVNFDISRAMEEKDEISLEINKKKEIRKQFAKSLNPQVLGSL